MDRAATVELDPVLHQPVRTRIAAFLATRGECTFSELKRVLDSTDGNLEAHLRKFIAARYVKVRKEEGETRPQTVYRLTSAGLSAFQTYVDAMQRLLKF